MKVLNIHRREINSPKDEVLTLFNTLSQKDDKIWPIEYWPPMKLDKAINVNSKGGHGPIRYKVISYSTSGFVEFEFQKPKGFDGTHSFEITELTSNKTEVKHTINMKTTGVGTLIWIIAIRWLHDALLEDAFDKIENQLGGERKKTEWNLWVKSLRRILKPKKKK